MALCFQEFHAHILPYGPLISQWNLIELYSSRIETACQLRLLSGSQRALAKAVQQLACILSSRMQTCTTLSSACWSETLNKVGLREIRSLNKPYANAVWKFGKENAWKVKVFLGNLSESRMIVLFAGLKMADKKHYFCYRSQFEWNKQADELVIGPPSIVWVTWTFLQSQAQTMA